MKRRIATLALFLSACGGGSSTDNRLPPQLINYADLGNFDDYASQMSANGQRAAFLSRRDAGNYRIYLHDQAAGTNPKKLQDLVSLEEGEQELRFGLSSDGQWLIVERQSPAAHYFLLTRWDGQVKGKIDLSQNVVISDLSIWPGTKPTLAYAQRVGTNLSVKVVQLTENGAAVTTSEIGSFAGEKRPLFSELAGGVIMLLTETPDPKGSSWRARIYDATANTWSDKGTPFIIAGQENRLSPSARGLFYARPLGSVRTKTKLGSNTERPTDYVPVVGVLDSLFQFDPTGATPVDLSAPSYRAYESLSISSVSASPDGSYLLLSGSETYFCKTSAERFNSMLLVRTSDMSAVPLFIARPTGQPSWSEIFTDPCTYFDLGEGKPAKDFDRNIAQAHLAGTDGSTFRVIYESLQTNDREVFRLEFKVDDWAAKTLSGLALANISNNARP